MNNKTVLSVTNEKKAPGESPGRNIKLQTKHSTIHIPVPGKNGELDVKVETNVIPTRRADYYANLFITKLAPVMCMFCILLLAFMLNYQASQLHAAMLKVDCLSERVDELNVKSADLKGRLAILQEKYDVIVSEQPKAKRPNSLINDGREEMNDDNDTTLEIDSVPIITLDKLLDFSANLENQTNVRKNPLNATTENTDAPKLSIATTNGVPEAVENELLINKDLPNSAGDGSLIRAKRSNRRAKW